MNILVVDDSATFRHLMMKMLNELGYRDLYEAGSVEEAKRELSSNQIDLIFSDWHMPGGSGLELLRHVRANPGIEHIPFVMITTEQQKNSIVEAVKCGLQSYLFKPVQKEVLSKKLLELSKSHGIKPPFSS